MNIEDKHYLESLPEWMTELQTQIESNYLVNQIDFTVHGNPVPQGRPRATTVAGYVTLYDPSSSRQWKQVIGLPRMSLAHPSPLLCRYRCN
ncbi:MAG: hypothetical protein SFH39_00950 [Candidatus Magnetobacterium sp. LHC-1]